MFSGSFLALCVAKAEATLIYPSDFSRSDLMDVIETNNIIKEK